MMVFIPLKKFSEVSALLFRVKICNLSKNVTCLRQVKKVMNSYVGQFMDVKWTCYEKVRVMDKITTF